MFPRGRGEGRGNLPERLWWYGKAVLTEDGSRRETRAERKGAFEKCHPFAYHGKGVDVHLAVVADLPGDHSSAEAPYLQYALRVVGKELLAEHLKQGLMEANDNP